MPKSSARSDAGEPGEPGESRGPIAPVVAATQPAADTAGQLDLLTPQITSHAGSPRGGDLMVRNDRWWRRQRARAVSCVVAIATREPWVQPTSRTAAEQLRSRLLGNQASPALVRSTLDRVPREDRDAWLDLLLDVDEIRDDGPDLPRGCVPYLPCPVSTVLGVVDQAGVTPTDVFVDVGSGIGRTLFLAHLLTGAGCIGIEIQSALMKLATGRAAWLNLTRTRFIHADAVDLTRFITIGSVFFLYCPFSGDRLERFLDGLEGIARTRQIRVCCVDMAPLERPWLTRLDSTSPEFDVYRSR